MKFLNPLSANVEYNPHGDTSLVAVVAPQEKIITNRPVFLKEVKIF